MRVILRGTYRGVATQIVGWLFIATAILKAAEPQDAMLAVLHFIPAEPPIAFAIVAFVVLAELALGAMLIAGLWGSRPVRGALALLVIFTFVLIGLIATDGPLSCGCGGRLFEWFPHAWSREIGIIRNLLLMVALMPLLRDIRNDSSNSADGRREDVSVALQGETT
jgi:hypothetical protein